MEFTVLLYTVDLKALNETDYEMYIPHGDIINISILHIIHYCCIYFTFL